MLEVFQLTNTQLGDIFAVYGVVGMLAYFPGGVIADYFSARKLMAVSLVATALGGFYLYFIPSIVGLYFLFAYWGITTILLFWAAMIKATREWGGTQSQGVAFGFLDGGRGLTASIFASIAVVIFSFFLADQLDNPTTKTQAFQSIILFYSLVTLLAALVIWLIIPDNRNGVSDINSLSSQNIFQVIKNTNVWLQGGIIIAAYCGFKSLDNYGIYAVQVLGMNDVESAEFTTIASYTRPVAAVAAGLLADRWLSSKLTATLFTITAFAFLLVSQLTPTEVSLQLVLGNLLITFIAVYALRGIYFTLIEESKIKSALTGTAVGLISVIGYTPDIFFSPITGRILDANPGLQGFQHYFILLTFISALGLLCTYFLGRRIRSNQIS
nr:MFS transporter [Aliikangiella coralliicola]